MWKLERERIQRTWETSKACKRVGCGQWKGVDWSWSKLWKKLKIAFVVAEVNSFQWGILLCHWDTLQSCAFCLDNISLIQISGSVTLHMWNSYRIASELGTRLITWEIDNGYTSLFILHVSNFVLSSDAMCNIHIAKGLVEEMPLEEGFEAG